MKQLENVNAVPSQSAVLRYRHDALSVTAMAGRRMWLYVQHGAARMCMRLSVGWFGVASMQFPAIEELGGGRYRLHVVLKGSYRDALPPEATADFHGEYAKLPNEQRGVTHPVELPITLELTLAEDKRLDIDAVVDGCNFINLQFICMFDAAGELEVAQLPMLPCSVQPPIPAGAAPAVISATGEAVYTHGGNRIVIQGPPAQHRMLAMRNDVHEHGFQNVLLNYTSPLRERISIRFD